MRPLGSPLPPFRLPDPRGGAFGPEDFEDARVLVIGFICNHCPFVRHIAAGLAQLDRDLRPRGARFIAINSNDPVSYPDDAPPRMIEEAAAQGWDFPYLFDETQATARAFGAACTPDFFVYDADRRLAYRGCLDESRPGSDIPVTGAALRAAVTALLDGRRPAPDQRPSIGCSIKWRPDAPVEPADGSHPRTPAAGRR